MMQLTRSVAVVDANAAVFRISNDGSGQGIRILQSGAGDAVSLLLDGASTATQGIVITETAVARTTPMVALARDAAATGKALEITNPGSGLSLHVVSGDAQFDGDIGFYGTAPVAQTAYTLNAVAVVDRTLLASASATILNNNNVIAAIVTDLKANGMFG